MNSHPFFTILRRDERGSSLVELSLILPILVVMLLGVVNYALVLSQYMTVIDSARAAAEYALLTGHTADIVGMQTEAALFASGIPGYHAAASIVCTCGPGGAAVSCSSSTCTGGIATAQYAVVQASASLPLLFKQNASGVPTVIPVQSTAYIRTTFTSGL